MPTTATAFSPGSSTSIRNNYNQHTPAPSQYQHTKPAYKHNVSIDDYSYRTIRNRNDLEQQQQRIYSAERQQGFDLETELELPSPVYALQGRLLAYASPPPRPDEVSVLRGDDSIYASARAGSGLATGLGGLVGGVTGGVGGGGEGVDVGSVAMKVGGSVLSGFKTLGGMAYRYGAAKIAESQGRESLASSTAQARGGNQQHQAPGGGITTKFFSKSAPAATPERHRRSLSMGGSSSQSGTAEVNVTPSRSTPVTENGYYVTVVDLAGLSNTAHGISNSAIKPRAISEFLAFKSHPVAKLSFSADGTSLLAVPKDGQATKVFQIRPGAPKEAPHQQAWQVYSLRRGRTSAVVEEVDWAQDGRWIAIGTRKRTIHVFAVNPYGGPPDPQSHIQGKVFGMTEMVSLLSSPTVED
jgi:hypothetical protein